MNFENKSLGTDDISPADDIGNKIFLAPESKHTCNVFANSSTLLTVPPMLILPNITKLPCIGFFNALLHIATNEASDMSFDGPFPCKSSICSK